eukprot:maker-scaffold_1-snap-gene-21.49-mRNA-1 protein AED:0.02 eAED:0.02 QI:0/0.66/0.5/1/1/1/4/59/576
MSRLARGKEINMPRTEAYQNPVSEQVLFPENEPSALSSVQPQSIQVPPPGVPYDFGNTFEVHQPIQELYELKGEIGKGAFSVVHEAVCRSTGERVAVKIISYHTFKPNDHNRQIRILENEIRIMQKIMVEIPESKSLPQLKKVVRERDRLGIVMDLMEGRELFERIVERKKYTERDAAQLMKKLVNGIKQLHDHNILHRDLKPENLVFASEGEDAEIKISDFGLGCVTNWPDVHHSVVGTPNYVAPEVVTLDQRGPLYTPACDVSLGIILYILLVGYPPFFHENPRELFRIIRSGKFSFHQKHWSGISQLAKDLISKMLVVNVEKRITTNEILAHPWFTSETLEAGTGGNLTSTITNLKKLNLKRRFKAAAMVVVWGAQLGMRRKLLNLIESTAANVFSIHELKKIREAFVQSLAENRDSRSVSNAMSVVQFSSAMNKLGFGHLPIKRMFALFDKNGDGSMDYKEFLSSLATLRESGESALKLCFDIYDEEGNGYIRKGNVEKVLRSVLRIDEKFDTSDIEEQEMLRNHLEAIFSAFDTNKDGQISYEEFKEGIFSQGPILIEHFLEPLDHIEEQK